MLRIKVGDRFRNVKWSNLAIGQVITITDAMSSDMYYAHWGDRGRGTWYGWCIRENFELVDDNTWVDAIGVRHAK